MASELFYAVGDNLPQLGDRPCSGFAEQGFEFGKRQFDRIEVRRIGRKVKELSAEALDRLSDPGHLVRGKIVHDDEVSLCQFRHKNLFDVSEESVAVHRTV